MSRFPSPRTGTEALGEAGRAVLRAHSTPEPDVPHDPQPPVPDDVPRPANAPVQEPTLPEPPLKVAGQAGPQEHGAGPARCAVWRADSM